ncbi:MAG: hypothetical protein V4850_04885 [Myxococcota bacterium]
MIATLLFSLLGCDSQDLAPSSCADTVTTIAWNDTSATGYSAESIVSGLPARYDWTAQWQDTSLAGPGEDSLVATLAVPEDPAELVERTASQATCARSGTFLRVEATMALASDRFTATVPGVLELWGPADITFDTVDLEATSVDLGEALGTVVTTECSDEAYSVTGTYASVGGSSSAGEVSVRAAWESDESDSGGYAWVLVGSYASIDR